MAVQPASANGGLQRTTGSFLAGNADFTYMYWAIPLGIAPTDGKYRTFHLIYDGSAYLEENSNADSNDFITFGADSGGFSGATRPALSEYAIHVAQRYDNTAKTIETVINGVTFDTITGVDFSAVTFNFESLCSEDGPGNAYGNVALRNYRSFQQKLTNTQIATQSCFDTAALAGFTTNLFCDTPLTDASDLADVSGNGRDWVTLNSGVIDSLVYDVLFETSTLPPPNISYATALNVNISTNPIYQGAQYVRSGSTTYNVYYSFTNDTPNDMAIVVWAYGLIPDTGALYNPQTDVNFDVFGTPSNVGTSFPNNPIPVSIKAGDVAYCVMQMVRSASTPAPLYWKVKVNPTQQTITAGMVFIPSASDFFTYYLDNGGFQAGFIDPATGDISNINPFFLTAEQGDILESGTSAFVDDTNTTQPPPGDPTNTEYVVIYDIDFNLVTRTLIEKGPLHGLLRTNNATDRFWAMKFGGGGQYNKYYAINEDGSIEFSSELTGQQGVNAFASSNDELLVYFTGVGPSGADSYSTIKTWDVNANTLGPDFASFISGYYITDILVLSNNDLVVLYFKKSGTRDIIIKLFNSAGTILNTFNPTFDETLATTSPRLGYSALDPDRFWLLAHLSTGFDVTRKVITADGTYEFDNTTPNQLNVENEQINPALKYISDTCPIIEIRQSVVPPPPMNPLSGIYKIIPWSRKPNDTLYTSLDPVETENVKIPDPYADTGLLGK